MTPSFDNVVSTFGVMFAPNQGQAASELIRVCKEGGKIGLANWTPDGFIGQIFKTVGRHVPPPAGISSPAAWGTKVFLEKQFASRVSKIEATPRQFNFRYHSPKHWLDIFSTYYGPIVKAFEALDEAAGVSLRNRPGAIDRAAQPGNGWHDGRSGGLSGDCDFPVTGANTRTGTSDRPK